MTSPGGDHPGEHPEPAARDALDVVIERLWIVNQERIRNRLLDLLSVLEALAIGHATNREVGVGEAHVLAGSLGTYGRAGSDLMKEIQQTLEEATPAQASEFATRVRHLVVELYGE